MWVDGYFPPVLYRGSPLSDAIFIRSREETDRFGRIIADVLQPGDVIGLTGDLGAGKTYLAGRIAYGLGVPETVPIASPTFTLIKEYTQGRLPIYHMDLYRLGDPQELFELGLWEYYDGDGICLVEWSNLFSDLWPDHALVLDITLKTDENRIFNLEGSQRGKMLKNEVIARWNRHS